jgi:hypothetical protein
VAVDDDQGSVRPDMIALVTPSATLSMQDAPHLAQVHTMPWGSGPAQIRTIGTTIRSSERQWFPRQIRRSARVSPVNDRVIDHLARLNLLAQKPTGRPRPPRRAVPLLACRHLTSM